MDIMENVGNFADKVDEEGDAELLDHFQLDES